MDAGGVAGADACAEPGAVVGPDGVEDDVAVVGATDGAALAAWLATGAVVAAGDGELDELPHATATTAISVNAVIPDRRFKAQPPHAWVTAQVGERTLQRARILR